MLENFSHCLTKTSKKSAETPHFDLLMKYIWCFSLRKWRLKVHKDTISNSEESKKMYVIDISYKKTESNQ